MNEDARAPVLTELTADHLPQALHLSTELGWPYRLSDWAFAYGLGKGLALELDGQLIGTAMRYDYGDTYTSVGMVIVDQAFQGRGYGSRLVDALLDSVGSRAVFLNATADAFELYRRRGFIATGTLNQHQGIPEPGKLASPSAHIKIADASDIATVMELDRAGLGMPRGELLKQLAAVGQMSLLYTDGVASAYATCREFGRGIVIGPVVAPSLNDACVLIEATMTRLPGKFIRVDTSAESGLSPWLEARGLNRVDSVSMMIRGAAPNTSPRARLFALCSQSLG